MHVPPKILAGFLLIAVAGCGFTPQGDAARQLATVAGAKAVDEGLVNAEWFICKAASVGAVARRYWQSVDKAEAWRKLCLGDPAAPALAIPASQSPGVPTTQRPAKPRLRP